MRKLEERHQKSLQALALTLSVISVFLERNALGAWQEPRSLI